MPVTKLKKGYEAIEYVFKKALTKKGVQGITTIPGPAYKMQIKRLTDAMADKMGKMGYDINNVTEKQVQGLLDYAQAIDNQRLKNIERKFFDPSGKMKKEGQDIVKKGLEGLGKKKDPFMGWTPKVVPKETVTASPDRIRKGFSTQMKLNRPEENQALIKSFMKRENAEFNALSREQQKEIFDMFDAHMRPKKPDMASGGIARVGMFVGGPVLAKGAKWFIGSVKKNLTDLKAGHPRFKDIPAEEQKMLVEGYETFIKQLEAGGEVPKEALEAISKNPQYYKTKKVVRSQDPDLAEVEELIDEKVFGHVRQELKDMETVGK